MNDHHEDLADLIMRRLDELGLSQNGLAREAGISADTVRKVLRGEGQSFRRLTLASVSRALGWPPDALEQLFDGHENPWGQAPSPPWATAWSERGRTAASTAADAEPDADDEGLTPSQVSDGSEESDDGRDASSGVAGEGSPVDPDLLRRVERLERILAGRDDTTGTSTDEDDLRRRIARLEDLALDHVVAH